MQVIRFGNQSHVPISIHGSADYGSKLVGESLIGVSKWSNTARMLVAVHASHDNSVILEGERGTGKKLIARLIHRLSSRHEGPFVSLSLGSTTDESARSVLFGELLQPSVESSSREKGLAELAEGGTLYIEGISQLSPTLVDDIIRLAEPQRYVNGEGSVRVLFGRVVQSASDKPTVTGDAAIAALGYERIFIPPLRERVDDIEPLAVQFIRERCEQSGKELRRISPEAMKAMRAYDWPQNVTELRTLVNQLVRHLSPPLIDVARLPAYLAGPYAAKSPLPDTGIDLENEIRRVEVHLICAALRQARGLQNKAAQLLGLRPTTLFMKIRRLGIDVRAFR